MYLKPCPGCCLPDPSFSGDPLLAPSELGIRYKHPDPWVLLFPELWGKEREFRKVTGHLTGFAFLVCWCFWAGRGSGMGFGGRWVMHLLGHLPALMSPPIE